MEKARVRERSDMKESFHQITVQRTVAVVAQSEHAPLALQSQQHL
jgi:hypothetical protein